jgi:hypothetical protein
MSILPKRRIKNPATAAEIAITNRNVANIYKGLEYGSYALGGLGLVKGGASLLKGYIKKQGLKNKYKVYRGENKENVQWDTAGGKLLGRFYFGGESKKSAARSYASGGSYPNVSSARVYSILLPKTQYNIAKKIAARREGASLSMSGEVNIPKLYVGKQKLEIGQTLLAQGEALKNKLINYKTRKKIKSLLKWHTQ